MPEGIVPITERFLKPNFLFSLEFKEGYVFGRVVTKRNLHYRPYYVINTDGTAAVIQPATAQAALRFLDPRNTQNDVLFLPQFVSPFGSRPWFLFGAIGMQQPDIFMYLHSPEGGDVAGRFPNIDPIQPSKGDKFGYVSHQQSPYEEPTDWVELAIVPNMHVSAEYYNKSADLAIQPQLNLLFNMYTFEILNAKNRALVGKMARREIQSTMFRIGFGNTPEELGNTVQDNWKVAPVDLDTAEGYR